MTATFDHGDDGDCDHDDGRDSGDDDCSVGGTNRHWCMIVVNERAPHIVVLIHHGMAVARMHISM